MSKSNKKAAKELERLQALYKGEEKKQIATEKNLVSPIKDARDTKHDSIRRELIFLIILIIAMLALLFAVNYWVGAEYVSKLTGSLL